MERRPMPAQVLLVQTDPGVSTARPNRRLGTSRPFLATAACTILLPALVGAAWAQAPAPLPPEKLSWNGDLAAPDLSGVWVRADPARAQDAAASAAKNSSKEGWQPWPPPLTPEFAAVWQKRVADAETGKRTDDPIRSCLPPGVPRFVTGTNGPLLIIQTPGRVTMYREGDPVRRIWLDGRSQPKAADVESFSNGNAVGHYEGGDLVTDIIGFKDYPIDGTGVPHSDDLKVVERYRRVDAKTLVVQVELTDPAAYTTPMTTTVTYAALDDPLWEPKEFVCTPGTDYHPETYVH